MARRPGATKFPVHRQAHECLMRNCTDHRILGAMFTDGPSPFRPRRESHSLAVTLCLLIIAALGLYAASERMRAQKPRAVRAEATLRPVMEAPPLQPQRAPVQVERSEETAAYRRPQYESPPARATIYLCKSYAGSAFWTNGTCSSQRATIDRITTVPGALPFDEQVAMASREAASAAELYGAPMNAVAVGATAPPAPQASECLALAERIRTLDALARQPQSGQMQDSIRSERVSVMSRRAAMHC
ncbi:hypothetical protein RFUL19S_01220 [Rhizobacter fulvus]